MGWSSIHYESRPHSHELNRLVKQWMESDTCHIIDRSAWMNHGKRQFLLMEANSPKEGTTTRRFVIMMLVEHRRRELLYKDIDESMGPLQYDCPIRIMKQLEGHAPTGRFSDQWRQKVLRHHQDTKPRNAILRKLRKDYSKGDRRIVLNEAPQVEYRQGDHRGRKSVSAYQDPSSGQLYLLRPHMIDVEATTQIRSTHENSEQQPAPFC